VECFQCSATAFHVALLNLARPPNCLTAITLHAEASLRDPALSSPMPFLHLCDLSNTCSTHRGTIVCKAQCSLRKYHHILHPSPFLGIQIKPPTSMTHSIPPLLPPSLQNRPSCPRSQPRQEPKPPFPYTCTRVICISWPAPYL